MNRTFMQKNSEAERIKFPEIQNSVIRGNLLKKVVSIFILGTVFSVYGPYTLMAQKDVVKEERSVSGFTKFDIGVSGEVFLTQGKVQQLLIEGDPKIISDIETRVSNGTLRVRYPNRLSCFQTHTSPIKIYITMPDIEAISISGSAHLTAETPLVANSLGLTISGSGRIRISDLTAERINSRISGSGGLEIGGSKKINEHDITISGSGNINMQDLPIGKANVKISGSGSCRIYVLDQLNAIVSGSGAIHYSGNPLINAKISGSGRVLQAK